MAENKMGPNLQAGAGFLAKRVQKSLNRAQEKVLQKLGKTMETKDEQFEQCSQSVNKQQSDGVRLFKDVKNYYTAVKAMHESSKRLSHTLKDVYESDWNGGEDLSVIIESQDLLWNDYEEKLSDQIVRTMENYTSQFPEVKERVAKRGRKLVDYDSARHHLEAIQSAKKKDDGKVSKAEEEFNKAQNVFEEINNELREELPVLYQSRIGCYVTVFQNISNLRDVFYKEMSVLNRELYNVMKKLETQHSAKEFIIKGLNSAKSKKRKSLIISNPIPCNTAFPEDHVSLYSSAAENGSEAMPTAPGSFPPSTSEGDGLGEGDRLLEEAASVPFEDGASFDSDELGSSGTNTPKSRLSHSTEEAEQGLEAELGSIQSDDSGVGVPKSEVEGQKAACPPELPESIAATSSQSPDPEEVTAAALPQASHPKMKPPPIPAPRLSFRSTDRHALHSGKRSQGEEDGGGEEEEEEEEEVAAEEEGTSSNPEPHGSETDSSPSQNPPGLLFKGVALEKHAPEEEGLLRFDQGDVILVLQDSTEEGMLKGIREETWNQHRDVENHSGIFMEKLIQLE